MPIPAKVQTFLDLTYPTETALAPEALEELQQLELDALTASLRLQSAFAEARRTCGHPANRRVWHEVERTQSDVVSVVYCRDCRKRLVEELDSCPWGKDVFQVPG